MTANARVTGAASTIKSEYPESQWDEYRIPEIDAAIAKVES